MNLLTTAVKIMKNGRCSSFARFFLGWCCCCFWCLSSQLGLPSSRILPSWSGRRHFTGMSLTLFLDLAHLLSRATSNVDPVVRTFSTFQRGQNFENVKFDQWDRKDRKTLHGQLFWFVIHLCRWRICIIIRPVLCVCVTHIFIPPNLSPASAFFDDDSRQIWYFWPEMFHFCLLTRNWRH